METEWARKRRKAYFGVVLAPLGKCTHNAGMIANRNIMYSTVGIFLFLNVVVGRGTKIITLRFHWQALGTRLLLWESETFPTLQMFTVSYSKTLRAQRYQLGGFLMITISSSHWPFGGDFGYRDSWLFNMRPDFSRVPPCPDFSRVLPDIILG